MTAISTLAAVISALTSLVLVVLAIKDHRSARIAIEELERRLQTLASGHRPDDVPPDLSVPGWVLKLISPAEAARWAAEWREHLWSLVESGEIREALKDRRRLAATGIAMAVTGRIRRVPSPSVPTVRATKESLFTRGFGIESRIEPLQSPDGQTTMHHTLTVANYTAVECFATVELSLMGGLVTADGDTAWRSNEIELGVDLGTAPSFRVGHFLSALDTPIQDRSAVEIRVYVRRRPQSEAKLIGVVGHVISTASDIVTANS